VMADPPWYEEETRAFLWAAASVCELGGLVFLSTPPLGVRPGMADERRRVLEWATTLGLFLDETESLALSYETPAFEANALKASGFDEIPADWRRGDLLSFRKITRTVVPKPELHSSLDNWDEFRLGVGSVWIRGGRVAWFEDPRLVPL